MIHPRRVLGASLLLLSSVGCAPEPEPEAEPVAVDTAAVREEIDAVRERELAALTGGDVEGLTAVYTDDCEVMPPDAPAVSGRDGVRAWAEDMLSQFTASGGYTGSEIDVRGDWTIERYTGELVLTPESGGDAIEEHVKGIHIYERQEDGSWLIQHDIWNTLPSEASQE